MLPSAVPAVCRDSAQSQQPLAAFAPYGREGVENRGNQKRGPSATAEPAEPVAPAASIRPDVLAQFGLDAHWLGQAASHVFQAALILVEVGRDADLIADEPRKGEVLEQAGQVGDGLLDCQFIDPAFFEIDPAPETIQDCMRRLMRRNAVRQAGEEGCADRLAGG